MSDAVVSLIRTYVPVLVGALASWLLTLDIEVDSEAQAGLIAGLTGVLTAAYYGLARLLESKWPAFGLLLGSTRKPHYDDGAAQAGRHRDGDGDGIADGAP